MREERPRCAKTIHVPETYRRTGRGRSGFEMHYTKQQCSRFALKGKEMCWQHDGERGYAAMLKAWKTRQATRRWKS